MPGERSINPVNLHILQQCRYKIFVLAGRYLQGGAGGEGGGGRLVHDLGDKAGFKQGLLATIDQPCQAPSSSVPWRGLSA